jgi:hypothetical protein
MTIANYSRRNGTACSVFYFASFTTSVFHKYLIWHVCVNRCRFSIYSSLSFESVAWLLKKYEYRRPKQRNNQNNGASALSGTMEFRSTENSDFIIMKFQSYESFVPERKRIPKPIKFLTSRTSNMWSIYIYFPSGAVIFFWSRCFLLKSLFFSEAVIFFWSHYFLLKPLFSSEAVVFFWSRYFFFLK